MNSDCAARAEETDLQEARSHGDARSCQTTKITKIATN